MRFPGPLSVFLILSAGALLAAPTPAPPTLAQALVTLRPQTGLVLSVGTERVPLPTGVEMPAADASAQDIATVFGCRADTFGVVTTIASATKVALNTNPAPPEVFSDLNSTTAFKMLAASLDNTQWQALTSATGLGLTDLTDETQKALFHAFFNNGHLWIASEDPEMAKLPDDQRTDVKDVSDQIDGVRIRLGQVAKINLHDTQGKPIYFSGTLPNAASRLNTWHPKQEQEPQADAHNVLLRAVVPNTPTDGNLRPDDPAFRVGVSWAGLHTVNDLITRIAAQTHREIYADPHYAKRALTILGPAVSASAGDLLRGLAQAVAGTYRQVGPALVLTDDLAGVGARRQRLAEWEDAARNASTKLGGEAGQTLLARHSSAARTLPSFGDSLALTPEQMAAIKDEPGHPGVPSMMESIVPFAKLTPDQQAWGRHNAEEYEEQRTSNTLPSYMTKDPNSEADLKGNVSLRANFQVQLLVPGVATPVDSSVQWPVSMLYYPGDAAAEEDHQAITATPPAPLLPPAPPLASVLRSRPRRAVLGHPRTPAEVDALIAAMRKIGLNELWLDVFSAGVAHIPNSPLSAKSIPIGSDILAEALTQTQGTGIRVYADMSLLFWGDAAPEAAYDRTILGKTDADTVIHVHEISVSPAASQVREDLAGLVRLAAAHAGLAGFVWEDADAHDSLGYAPEMRLNFLRAAHADPLDITPSLYLRMDASLPTFDDADAENKLSAQWPEARQKSLVSLLTHLRGSLPSPASDLPILMDQGGAFHFLLASWDDPKALPPELRTLPEPIAAAARAQSRTVIWRERIENDGDTDALARALKADLDSGKWDGYVLDFRRESMTQGKAPLDSLVRAVSQKAPRPDSGEPEMK